MFRFLSSGRLVLVVTLCSQLLQAQPELPMGNAPAALSARHFPDRVHEFVFRNWTAVEPKKLAEVLGTTPENVTAIAVSMGLPAEPAVAAEMRQRGYVTLIRRNWHLLPYAQLLQLLDMTAEELSFTLREEDFLWIKLGRLKPACEPLVYAPPAVAAQGRAVEIRRVVEEEFGNALLQPGEPRFDFVRQMNLPMATPAPPLAEAPPFERIVYSYVAVYGDPLLNPQLNPYPDGLLERLASVGVNGVWLQGLLRDLAPGGATFPEFGARHEERLESLRAMVARAAKFGVRVYLYLNEPRGMPAGFFVKHPELAGVTSGELTALCTSTPEVRQWMGDALAHIFTQVPDLGGVYVITASENLTNCASHGGWSACPRCKERTDTDILAEVNGVIEKGVHRGSPTANVLISDWGWKGHGDAPDIIARLPKDVWLMSVSEWSLPIERGGVKSVVGEYSMSSVGPGPRSVAHWKNARDAGLKTGAEIQFNNTCEIATLPYIPVMDIVAEHCSNLLAAANLDGMLIGWTMGGYPSPNIQLAQRLSRNPAPTVDSVLSAMALDRFGPEGAPLARKAWTSMSEAYREYPFHISVVYTSPVQWGAANPLYAERTGYSATMWGIPYDDVDGWRGPYPPEVLAAQFEKVAQGWQPGLGLLAAAVERAPAALRREVEADLRLGRAGAIHFQSVANQTRFVAARNLLKDPATAADQRDALRQQMGRILESEIELARELYTLVQEDSRIGFEPSCQYFYLPLDLVEKTINCRWLLDHLEEWAPIS